MAQSELDKLLKAFEEKNAQVVKIAGLLFDFILYQKNFG